MFTRVLVPLDGSQVSAGILPYIMPIIRRLSIPVTALYVLDPDELDIPREATSRDVHPHHEGLTIANLPGTMAFGAGPVRPLPDEVSSRPPEYAGASPQVTGDTRMQIIENAQLQATRRLEEMVAPFRRQDMQVEALAAVGQDPAEEIVRTAQQRGCDLIAMSTHGRGFFSRAISGSVASDVLRVSPMPVMVVRSRDDAAAAGNDLALSSIIVPLDGSEFAERALPYAAYLAEALSLQVVLVRVLASGDTSLQPGGALPYPDSTHVAATQEMESQAIQYLGDIAYPLTSRGLDVRWHLLRGAPANSLVEFAVATPANMIVLASHGRSGLKRWLLGSVAEDLIRHSGDPVLVIPLHETERPS